MLTNVSFETAVQYNNTLDYGSQGRLKPASRHSLFVIFLGGRGEGAGRAVAAKESANWIARNGLGSKLSLKCFSV